LQQADRCRQALKDNARSRPLPLQLLRPTKSPAELPLGKLNV